MAASLQPLTARGAQRASEELRRLRDSLRPASASEEPALEPIESVWSADDRLLMSSANVRDHLGWDPAYLMRITPGHWLCRPGDLEPLYAHFHHCLMGHEVRGAEYRVLHADGTGYVWFSEDMFPRRRRPDGRVRDVRLRTYNVTPIRAREVDFLIECLGLFHPERDSDALEELGVPALLSNLVPWIEHRGAGRVIPFRMPEAYPPPTPGMEPALSSDFPAPHRRR